MVALRVRINFLAFIHELRIHGSTNMNMGKCNSLYLWSVMCIVPDIDSILNHKDGQTAWQQAAKNMTKQIRDTNFYCPLSFNHDRLLSEIDGTKFDLARNTLKKTKIHYGWKIKMFVYIKSFEGDWITTTNIEVAQGPCMFCNGENGQMSLYASVRVSMHVTRQTWGNKVWQNSMSIIIIYVVRICQCESVLFKGKMCDLSGHCVSDETFRYDWILYMTIVCICLQTVYVCSLYMSAVCICLQVVCSLDMTAGCMQFGYDCRLYAVWIWLQVVYVCSLYTSAVCICLQLVYVCSLYTSAVCICLQFVYVCSVYMSAVCIRLQVVYVCSPYMSIFSLCYSWKMTRSVACYIKCIKLVIYAMWVMVPILPFQKRCVFHQERSYEEYKSTYTVYTIRILKQYLGYSWHSLTVKWTVLVFRKLYDNLIYQMKIVIN